MIHYQAAPDGGWLLDIQGNTYAYAEDLCEELAYFLTIKGATYQVSPLWPGPNPRVGIWYATILFSHHKPGCQGDLLNTILKRDFKHTYQVFEDPPTIKPRTLRDISNPALLAEIVAKKWGRLGRGLLGSFWHRNEDGYLANLAAITQTKEKPEPTYIFQLCNSPSNHGVLSGSLWDVLHNWTYDSIAPTQPSNEFALNTVYLNTHKCAFRLTETFCQGVSLACSGQEGHLCYLSYTALKHWTKLKSCWDHLLEDNEL